MASKTSGTSFEDSLKSTVPKTTVCVAPVHKVSDAASVHSCIANSDTYEVGLGQASPTAEAAQDGGTQSLPQAKPNKCARHRPLAMWSGFDRSSRCDRDVFGGDDTHFDFKDPVSGGQSRRSQGRDVLDFAGFDEQSRRRSRRDDDDMFHSDDMMGQHNSFTERRSRHNRQSRHMSRNDSFDMSFGRRDSHDRSGWPSHHSRSRSHSHRRSRSGGDWTQYLLPGALLGGVGAMMGGGVLGGMFGGGGGPAAMGPGGTPVGAGRQSPLGGALGLPISCSCMSCVAGGCSSSSSNHLFP